MRNGRTLFWFADGDIDLLELNNRFFPFANLLNRLLNEEYRGDKIKFINLKMSTEETYRLHPKFPRNYTNFYNGHLLHNAVFDFDAYRKLNEAGQTYFIWS